jgi:hypothetical protein
MKDWACCSRQDNKLSCATSLSRVSARQDPHSIRRSNCKSARPPGSGPGRRSPRDGAKPRAEW